MAKSTSAKHVGSKPAVKKEAAKKTDLIVGIASEIETLTQPKAFALVDEIIARSGVDDFRLGGALAVIYDKASAEGGDAWLDGHDSFKSLVSARFGVEYRKAMYLVNIYKNLVEKQIPWAAVKDIGWSKLAILASILTQKNVAAWAEKAAKHNIEELKELVAKAKAKGDGNAVTGDATEVMRKTFVFHGDQWPPIEAALSKAKKESKTEYDTVALVNIAHAYNGNAITMEVEDGAPKTEKEKSKAMLDLMKELGPENSLVTFDKVFSDWHISVKTPEKLAEDKAEAKELGIKYDPETFDVQKAVLEAAAKATKKK